MTTRSSQSGSSEQHQTPIPETLHSNDSESATIPSIAPPERNYTVADVPRLVQDRIEALEREAKLSAQLRDLQQNFIETLQGHSAADRQLFDSLRHPLTSEDGTAEGKDKDLDARDAPKIPTFQRSWSLQQRNNWLQKLELRFRGAPSRFRTGDKKVICALQNMSDSC